MLFHFSRVPVLPKPFYTSGAAENAEGARRRTDGDNNPRRITNKQENALGGIDGSMVEFSPPTRATRVRFPVDANFAPLT
ncbi:hypothetical protein L596_004866 [Steinernema carpocapsae]|uniref:Uncharacterized protein n=1 Tax=Steinernema carpocapsae TaxID=34508 RepID=A0A4U8V0Q3_STECR|nr:hypothetical protein L596_004866 [Steinernema carpocapsae]